MLLLLWFLVVEARRRALRDHFAAVALHAFITEPGKTAAAVARDCALNSTAARLALASYVLADEMMTARRHPSIPLLSETWPEDNS